MKLRFKAILGTAAIFAGMFTSMIGANANPPTLRWASGNCPLHAAAATGDADRIKIILQQGDNKHYLFERDFRTCIPLMYASTADVVNALTEGLDASELKVVLNATDECYRTALHRAANAEVAKRLIELGADVGARDNHRKLPIHYLVKLGNVDLIKLLIEEKGVCFNLDDENIWVHGERLQGHRPLYRLREYIQGIIDTEGPESSKLAGLREVEEYLVSIGGVSN